MSCATKEGTFGYLKKFGNYSKDFYRFNGELFFPSLGIGTYKAEPYKEENYIINYGEAIKTALRNGIHFIDTAINYRYQMSEREIGEALQEMIERWRDQSRRGDYCFKSGFYTAGFPLSGQSLRMDTRESNQYRIVDKRGDYYRSALYDPCLFALEL